MRSLVLALVLLLSPAPATRAQSVPPPDATAVAAAERRAAFRAFAERLMGEWRCEIREWDGTSSAPIWSDVQKRVFTLTMARHMLEERALLKTPEGREYEGGLHLTTFDTNRDRFVQHGFWLPNQADRLFVVDGRLTPDGVDAVMTIRLEAGGEETRPFRIRFDGKDRWTIRVEGRRPDGTAYLKEELVYARVGIAG